MQQHAGTQSHRRFGCARFTHMCDADTAGGSIAASGDCSHVHSSPVPEILWTSEPEAIPKRQSEALSEGQIFYVTTLCCRAAAQMVHAYCCSSSMVCARICNKFDCCWTVLVADVHVAGVCNDHLPFGEVKTLTHCTVQLVQEFNQPSVVVFERIPILNSWSNIHSHLESIFVYYCSCCHICTRRLLMADEDAQAASPIGCVCTHTFSVSFRGLQACT